MKKLAYIILAISFLGATSQGVKGMQGEDSSNSPNVSHGKIAEKRSSFERPSSPKAKLRSALKKQRQGLNSPERKGKKTVSFAQDPIVRAILIASPEKREKKERWAYIVSRVEEEERESLREKINEVMREKKRQRRNNRKQQAAVSSSSPKNSLYCNESLEGVLSLECKESIDDL